MSTYTRPQYTVRYGDETKFLGANYPMASKFATEHAPSVIENNGRIVKVVAVLDPQDDPFSGLGATDFEKGIL